MSKYYFIFLSKPAQHRLSSTSQTLGGQDSHPWWPRFLFYKYNQSDSTEGGTNTQAVANSTIIKPARTSHKKKPISQEPVSNTKASIKIPESTISQRVFINNNHGLNKQPKQDQ